MLLKPNTWAKDMPCCNYIIYQDIAVLKVHWPYKIDKLSSKMYSPRDALPKMLIEKGLITEAEFMQKLSDERAVYQAMLRKMR